MKKAPQPFHNYAELNRKNVHLDFLNFIIDNNELGILIFNQQEYSYGLLGVYL